MVDITSMRESEDATIVAEIAAQRLQNKAPCNPLLSLMVSLSNHEPCSCKVNLLMRYRSSSNGIQTHLHLLLRVVRQAHHEGEEWVAGSLVLQSLRAAISAIIVTSSLSLMVVMSNHEPHTHPSHTTYQTQPSISHLPPKHLPVCRWCCGQLLAKVMPESGGSAKTGRLGNHFHRKQGLLQQFPRLGQTF
ncbi:hypothetical protein SAMN05443582_101487 [Phyllobacterium sp. OV277]|nr:hypothetical protein SAMN05443582_101487 [Phyllobacterium sp. OV277]